jgi:MFS superfamily sulfate permease-like transporter
LLDCGRQQYQLLSTVFSELAGTSPHLAINIRPITDRAFRQLSIGPEAALSLLIGQMIQEAVYGDPHSIPKNPELEAAAIALVTTLQIGVITFGLGLLRLGFLDVVLSRALLRGFITAVGVVSIIHDKA